MSQTKPGAAVLGVIKTFGDLSEKKSRGGGGVSKKQSRQVVVGGFKCIFLFCYRRRTV